MSIESIQEKKRLFLKTIRKINTLRVFLLLALMESLISLIDSYLKLYLEFTFFSEMRSDLALIIFALACVVWIWTVAVPASSNRLALFASLTIVILNLTDCFFLLEENRYIAESLAQLLIILIICVLQVTQTVSAKKASWGDLGKRITGSLLSFLVLICVAVYTYSTGFLLVTPSGLFTVEYKYQLADKTVRLIPMVHVGDETYFRLVSDYLNQPGNLILLEGIKHQNGHKTRTTQKSSRLAAQNSALKINTEILAPGGKEFFTSRNEWEKASFVWSDMSSDNFSESTINALLNGKELLAQSDIDLYDFEVISLRNDRLLEHIKHAPSGGNILVPWGARHMPELHAQLTKDGYQHSRSQIRRVVGIAGFITLIRRNAIQGQILE